MAPKVTGNSNQTSVKTTTEKVVTKKKQIDIAKEMMKYADDNTAAIGKDGFQSLLRQIYAKGSILSVIKEYDKIYPDKSIIKMILSETGSNDDDMEAALIGEGNGKNSTRGLFTLLLDTAKELGVDQTTIDTYKNEFEAELREQLGKNSVLGQLRSLVHIDSSKLETIMRTLVQTIDNQIQLSTEEKAKLNNTPATESETKINNILNKRYETALENFNAQLQLDGWAGDLADGFSKIWNNKVGEQMGISTGNTATMVRKDLAAYKEHLEELEQAKLEGDASYRAKFKEIFKVAYNPANIVAYQNAEARYIEASKAKAQEDNFKSQFSVLLSPHGLQEESTSTISTTSGVPMRHITATKQQVYDREYKKIVKAMGSEGAAIIKQKYKEAGVENKSIDEKFKVLQILAKAVDSNFHKATTVACGGSSFDSIQKQYDNCYKAAFGLENDIMQRVNDYNVSQQRGAGVVKGATVATIVMACALTGQVEGIVAVAAVAAGSTAAAEITDNMTQKRNIDALRKDGVGAYLKSVGKNTDWGSIAKASLSSGAMMLAIGGASYPIANLCRIGASSAGLTGKALDIATGLGTNTVVSGGVLGTQYLMKGEITVEDAAFVVIMAVVGSTIQVLQINKAYAKAESAAVDAHIQNIQDARRTLGFEDGVEITPDMLKQQYKAMVKANHPDKGGLDINMAVINSARDYLQAHIADINIGLTGAKPQTINPTVEAARGNTTPQNTKPVQDLVVSDSSPVTVHNVETLFSSSNNYVKSTDTGNAFTNIVDRVVGNGKMVVYESNDGNSLVFIQPNTKGIVEHLTVVNKTTKQRISADIEPTANMGKVRAAIEQMNNTVGLADVNLPAIQNLTNTNPQAINPTALVTRENVVALKAEGYNVTTTPQNQIIAYTPEGKAIEVGTLGKTPMSAVKANLAPIADKKGVAKSNYYTPKGIVELSRTPEGITQLEEAGLVVTKTNIDKLGTIYEGQSQSPARAIKKIDFSGTPEEVCAKNPPLQYDSERGKFFREVSWDGGKTKQPMYIEENDPNGYFLINYGEEAWDGALLGGTEAVKSYVEPEAYNATGTKIPVDPSKMDYNWTTASKAAPVRFAKVPDGVKGIVGKEGFQPITDGNQVVAIDVKGNPYINTVDYVLNNTKGLDAKSIKTLLEIDPKADATKAIVELVHTPEGIIQLYEAGILDKFETVVVNEEGFPSSYSESKNKTYYIDGVKTRAVEHHQYNTTDKIIYDCNGRVRREIFTNEDMSGNKITDYPPNGPKTVHNNLRSLGRHSISREDALGYFMPSADYDKIYGSHY